MGFFDSLKSLFSKKKKEEKKKEEKVAWDALNYGKPAQPTNLTPIDIDPWKT
jgi:hypothetical protein